MDILSAIIRCICFQFSFLPFCVEFKVVEMESLPKECGRRSEVQVTTKINGGFISRQGRHPWIATIFYNKSKKRPLIPKCGGAILNKNYILTAGHCCDLGGFPPVSVRVGEFNLSKTYGCKRNEKCRNSVQDLEVNLTKIHPQYDIDYGVGWAHNDVCLVRLNGIIKYNEYVEPICLPKYADKTREDTDGAMEFAGWGKTATEFPAVLQEATFSIVPAKECDLQLPRELKHNSSSEICVVGDGMKPCRGDSGGPLVQRNKDGRFTVWGVASYSTEDDSDPNCMDSKPTVFADVTKYRKWIEDNIKP